MSLNAYNFSAELICIHTTVSNNKPPSPPFTDTPSLLQAPSSDFLTKLVPDFCKLDTDQKLEVIKYVRDEFEKDSEFKNGKPERYEKVMQALAEGEKRVKEEDRWYYKVGRGLKMAVRSIAWGPTILFNVLLSMFL